jgi:hypothetical protein
VRHVAIGSLLVLAVGLAAAGASFSWAGQREKAVSHANPLFKEPPSSLAARLVSDNRNTGTGKEWLFTDLSTARHQCRTWPVAQRPALFLF